jgi:hypothetical protein
MARPCHSPWASFMIIDIKPLVNYSSEVWVWGKILCFLSVSFTHYRSLFVSLLNQYEYMFRPNVAIIRFTYMYEVIALFWLCEHFTIAPNAPSDKILE